MQAYKFINKKEAITRLQDLKMKGKKKLFVYTIDFDENTETRHSYLLEDCCDFVRDSTTVIINEDEIVSHLQLFSARQTDIENIIKTGIIQDIILGT